VGWPGSGDNQHPYPGRGSNCLIASSKGGTFFAELEIVMSKSGIERRRLDKHGTKDITCNMNGRSDNRYGWLSHLIIEISYIMATWSWPKYAFYVHLNTQLPIE
jgi:hypothetical protein